jgi:peptidoglycan/LPS O-acetylase OafA/YrhL
MSQVKATERIESRTDYVPGPQVTEKKLLTPLTSIRFFAALHIFIFHVYGFYRFNPSARPSFFDELPAWIGTFFMHGFCSTSLFFLISGFILTYLYVDGAGRQTVSKRDFWLARLTRIYPLHITVLLLIAPAIVFGPTWIQQPTFFGAPISPEAYKAIGGVLSVTLTQAWFPEFALSWNFTTWALSAVVFFYLMFPPLVSWLRGMNRKSQWILLALMPVVSLIPSALYALATPAQQAGTVPRFTFWSEFIMRTPLLWLPHFFMGMLLARIFNISRHNRSWERPYRLPVSLGDAAFVALMALFCIDTGTLGGGQYSHLFMRHGLLAPLYLVLIHDLARNRGLVARLFCLPGLRYLGDASFSIFILQGPMLMLDMAAFGALAAASPPIEVDLFARFIVLLAATVAVSLLSVRFFERSVAAWLRRRWIERARMPQLNPPHLNQVLASEN